MFWPVKKKNYFQHPQEFSLNDVIKRLLYAAVPVGEPKSMHVLKISTTILNLELTAAALFNPSRFYESSKLHRSVLNKQ